MLEASMFVRCCDCYTSVLRMQCMMYTRDPSPRYHKKIGDESNACETVGEFRTPYNAFTSHSKKQSITDQKEIGRKWVALDDLERQKYERGAELRKKGDVKQHKMNVVVVDEACVPETPLGIGSRLYPVASSVMQDVTDNVDEYHKKWADYVGGMFGAIASELDSKAPARCVDMYGVGKCGHDLTAAAHATIKQMKSDMHAVFKLPRTRMYDCDALVLWHARPGGDPAAGSDVAPPRGRTILWAVVLGNPCQSIGFECEGCDFPRDGDVLQVNCSLGSIIDNVELTMQLFESSVRLQYYKLEYVFIELLQVRVTKAMDISDEICRIKASANQSTELRAISRMMKLEKVKFDAKYGGQGKRTKTTSKPCIKKLKVAAASDAEADSVEDKHSSSDESTASSVEGMLDVADVDAYWLTKHAEAAGLEDIAKIEDAEASLPRLVRSENKVKFFHWSTGKQMGTQSIVKPGQHGESISVYCNLHSCKCPLKYSTKAPDIDSVVRWFKEGESIPRGPEGRARHIRMYRDLCK